MCIRDREASCMHEKVLLNKKNGMAVMLLSVQMCIRDRNNCVQ